MIIAEYVRTMARYNQWQNNGLLLSIVPMSDEEFEKDRGAFFGSIKSTMNHLLWGDRIWMSRFALTSEPSATSIKNSVTECASRADLIAGRQAIDLEIISWASELETEKLASDLTWFSGAANKTVTKPFGFLVMHFFNHQTHHRGQIHAMLTSAGIKPNDTDLFFMPTPVQ
jgi:uncharacterized damage-inducible protein DinB